ncbi:MAG TPA: DUF2177 family protein [Acholeplasmataceae bacterium]|nr:DUF2177 family protein [Acholeplasmataceae bacterium]
MMYLKIFGVALVIFFAIDLLWLGLIAKNMYAKHLGFIMAPKVKWVAAIIFYVLFVIALAFFVIHPAIEKQSWSYALLVGMFFGFITYATYDLTNLATLQDWPIFITIVDLAWGSFLGGAVSILTFLILR